MGICECQLKSLDETCNTDCRRASSEIFRLVCPDPILDEDPYLKIGDMELKSETFENSMINGEILSNHTTCENSFETTRPIHIVSSGQNSFSGIYNPDPNQLIDIISKTGRQRRQANPAFESLSGDLIDQPVTCVELNDLVMFTVSRNSYTIYDRNSLFNKGTFDSGVFDELSADTLSDVPTPLFVQFSQPGVFTFVLSNSPRYLYVQVSVK